MVRPKNGLEPESQPWARSIERDISEQIAQAQRTAEGTSNAYKNINNTLQTLGDTIVALKATVAALPVSYADSTTQTGWQATNGAVIASVNIPWVAGKTRCDVVANIQGFYVADFTVPLSDVPAFKIGIAGVYQPPVPKIPDNMDTYWIIGSYSKPVTVGTSFNVTVQTATGPALSAPYAENSVYLGALAIFS